LVLTAIALTFLYRSSTYQIFDEPLQSAVTELITSAEPGETEPIILTRELIDPDYQRALSGEYWMIGEYDESETLIPLKASRSLAGESIALESWIKSSIDAQSETEFRTSSIGPDGEPLRALVSLFGLLFYPMAGPSLSWLQRIYANRKDRYADLAFSLLL